MDSARLRVLGTAQDAGVPQPFCDCANCLRARGRPEHRRRAASLAVLSPVEDRWHLVDATPDLPEQAEALRGEYPRLGLPESILLTHAHMGHYPGLMFFGKEAVHTDNLPVYAGGMMRRFLAGNAPWSQLVWLGNITFRTLEAGCGVDPTSGLRITPVEVPHRTESSETFGFVFSGASRSALYIPDIDGWSASGEGLEGILETVDVCLLDGTFYSLGELRGRDQRRVPHPPIEETMELLRSVVGDKEVYFTHLNHTNPVLDPDGEERRAVEERGFRVAGEGMEIPL